MSAVEVIVPTAGPTAGLFRLFESLAGQRAPSRWSVLVVDNAPTHNRRALVRRLAGGLSVPVRYLAEPRPGAAHARNRGLGAAEADVVVFVDDDVTVAPGWLAALATPVLDGIGGAAGGKVVADPEVSLPPWLNADLHGYLTALDLGPERRPLREGEYLLTASLAARRDLLRSVGGFDPVLGPRPGAHLTNDDLDLTRRLLASGRPVLWVPEARAVHAVPDERLSVLWLVRRLYAQGRSDYLLDRHRLRQGRLRGMGRRTVDTVSLLADRTRDGVRGASGPWQSTLWRALAVRGIAEMAQLAGFTRQALTDVIGTRPTSVSNR